MAVAASNAVVTIRNVLVVISNLLCRMSFAAYWLAHIGDFGPP
jgi:hypothetical protein